MLLFGLLLDSGRLFVWGENHLGQLGIPNSNNKTKIDSQNSNEWNNDNTDGIITKPTCVKSLKNLGLKIADIAFGQDWSVILTRKLCYIFQYQY